MREGGQDLRHRAGHTAEHRCDRPQAPCSRPIGAELVDAKGKSQVKSDDVRQALEYAQKLVKFLPADAVSYDDASNNRALISGKSALIFNPPSAWAVAKRDAPAGRRGLLDLPGAGRSRRAASCRTLPYFWGVWKFSQNKTAAKELIEFLMQRDSVEARCVAALGLRHAAVRQDARLQGLGRGRAAERHRVQLSDAAVAQRSSPHIAALPAPPEIAVQIYNRGMHADDAGEAEERPDDRPR